MKNILYSGNSNSSWGRDILNLSVALCHTGLLYMLQQKYAVYNRS